MTTKLEAAIAAIGALSPAERQQLLQILIQDEFTQALKGSIIEK